MVRKALDVAVLGVFALLLEFAVRLLRSFRRLTEGGHGKRAHH